MKHAILVQRKRNLNNKNIFTSIRILQMSENINMTHSRWLNPEKYARKMRHPPTKIVNAPMRIVIIFFQFAIPTFKLSAESRTVKKKQSKSETF